MRVFYGHGAKSIPPGFVILAFSTLFLGCAAKPEPATTLLRGVFPNEYLITSPSGQRIFIDPVTPAFLPPDLNAADILVVTNDTWMDVYNPDIVSAFPGRKLVAEAGSISAADAEIVSVPGKYGDLDYRRSLKGGYFMVSIKTPDANIFHLGQTSQSALNGEQAQLAGDVDILIGSIYIWTDDETLNIARPKLLEKIAPRIFIPAGFNDPKLDAALARYQGFYSKRGPDFFRVDRALLTEGRIKLLILDPSEVFVDYLKRTRKLKPL
jgi:hypothetical protein